LSEWTQCDVVMQRWSTSAVAETRSVWRALERDTCRASDSKQSPTCIGVVLPL